MFVFDTQNRKNDEASYEKMLKLRRDLSRAVTILEMIKRREKSKRELLHLTLEVFEKRFVFSFSRNTNQRCSVAHPGVELVHTQENLCSFHQKRHVRLWW